MGLTMKPRATLELHHATIELWPEHVRSVFRDGKEVTAAPNEGETIIATVCHEFLHHALAEATEDRPSVCLRAVANGEGNRWTPERRAEEGLAYSVGVRMTQLVSAMKKAGYV